MEELMDLMVNQDSPSQVSDKIKEILFARSAEKLEGVRPEVAASLFQDDESGVVDEVETTAETEE
jgi:hypothetical protein|tara:strand:+ start:129 stop:323 length:195 start_codon:yes stop_codon:yes gene_type:complete